MNSLNSRFYHFKNYWKIKSFTKNYLVRFQLFLYRLSKSISSYSLSTQLTYQIVKSIFSVSIFSVALFLCLEVLDRPITAWVKQIAIYFGYDLHMSLGELDQDKLLSVASTIAQVAGIFLGLYYAAVGVVVSTAYAPFPHHLRLLMLKERMGGIYINLTTILVVMSLVVISSSGVGYDVSRLNYLVLCLLVILSVLSFVRFGQHIFDLYDISRILTEPYRNLIDSIEKVSSLNHSYHRTIHELNKYEAENAMQVFEDVIFVSDSNKFDQVRVVNITITYLLQGFIQYAKVKGKISRESPWFPSAIEHRSWLTAESTYIITSLNTGTIIHPREVRDINWFESRVYSLVQKSLSILLRKKDSTTYIHTINIITNVVRILVENHAVKEAVELVRSVSNTIDQYVEKCSDIRDLDPSKPLPVYVQQLSTLQTSLYSQLVVSAGKSTENISLEVLSDLADLIVCSPGRLKKSTKSLPSKVLDEFHRLSDKIKFEIEIGKSVFTQKWYLEQILGLATARHFEEVIILISERLHSYLSKKYSDEYPLALQCHRLIGGVELLSKWNYHLGLLQGLYSKIDKSRNEKEIPFPIISFSEKKDDSEKLKQSIFDELFTKAMVIGLQSRHTSDLDFFGHSYFLCLEECRKCLCEGNDELFKKLFPIAFSFALIAYEAVDKELIGQANETRVVFMTESIIDIMSLSGLAFIYSELDDKSFSSVVEDVWDKHLEKVPDRKSFIKFLLMTIDYRKSIFSIKPRDDIRLNWDSELARILSERNLLDSNYGCYGWNENESLRKHPSALVRVIGRSSSFGRHAVETFICLYLLSQSESADLEVSVFVDSFRESLRKAENEG